MPAFASRRSATTSAAPVSAGRSTHYGRAPTCLPNHELHLVRTRSDNMAQRLGIDVGGTFTDVVVVKDDGTVAVEKVPSTPADPSQGIFDGIRKIEASRGIVPAEINIFAQGPTGA